MLPHRGYARDRIARETERARARVKQEFDWRELAQRYVDLYAEVAARRGRA